MQVPFKQVSYYIVCKLVLCRSCFSIRVESFQNKLYGETFLATGLTISWVASVIIVRTSIPLVSIALARGIGLLLLALQLYKFY